MLWNPSFVPAVFVVLTTACFCSVAAAAGENVRRELGNRLEDRTTDPLIPSNQVTTVVDLEIPPGNIATTPDAVNPRVFFTFHPEVAPPELDVKVAELVNGVPVPYPNEEFQSDYWKTPLAMRVDNFNRLWVLDYANYGFFHRSKLTAFNLTTGDIAFEYKFSKKEAGPGAWLNDFAINPQATTIFFSDTGLWNGKPGLVVFDVNAKTVRRVLEKDESVVKTDNSILVGKEKIGILGILPLRIAVNSIALDSRGEWLFYKPLNGGTLYRLKAEDLENDSLTDSDLRQRIEIASNEVTMSDGIILDDQDRVYLTDIEHFAITRLNTTSGQLETLIKDDTKFRWPNGLSFSGTNLYFTCSSMQDIIPFEPQKKIKKQGPFQIFRFEATSP